MTTRNEILGWMRRGIEQGKTVPVFEELLDAFVAEVREEERKKREKAVEAERLLTLRGVQHKWFSDGGIKTLEDIEIQIKALTQPNNN